MHDNSWKWNEIQWQLLVNMIEIQLKWSITANGVNYKGQLHIFFCSLGCDIQKTYKSSWMSHVSAQVCFFLLRYQHNISSNDKVVCKALLVACVCVIKSHQQLQQFCYEYTQVPPWMSLKSTYICNNTPY
jgi:hypothetical protein